MTRSGHSIIPSEMNVLAQPPEQLENALRKNPAISHLIDHWPELDLPNCWLVAGAVVQSYWNAKHGFQPLHGISDIDLIYFDPNDLTEDSESGHAARISVQFKNLGVRFDVKNEARVHLWYESRFGYPIAAYTSAESAIETFPTTAGSIGIRPAHQHLEAYAPFGFDDLLNLVVRPNKRQVTHAIYVEKVTRWKAIWPRLDVKDWVEV